MYKITKKAILNSVAERFKRQYPNNTNFTNGRSSDEIIKKLESTTNLTEKLATDIIGNSSWTRNTCDECKIDVKTLIKLGEDPDCESRTASICKDCLNKALSL